MNGITSLKIPDIQLEIDYEEFYQNNLLEYVDLNHAHTIGYSAFQECRFLNKIAFSPQTQMIHSNAFKKCVKLNSVKIPLSKNLTIEACAFLGCPLEHVDFGKRIDFSKIHDNTLLIAGNRCPVCKSKISKTRDGIYCPHCDKNYSWNDLEDFQKSHIEPAGVLKDYTGYNGLFHIPNGITAIAPQAFDDSAVSFVSIPDTVVSIGTRAFHWADRLTELEINTPNLTRLEHQTFTGTLLSHFSSPENLEYIGRSAFSGCTLLNSYYSSDSEKMIGELAFYGCSALEKLEIGSSTNIIGAYAFYGNHSLKSVNIPSSVLLLQEYCFADCRQLSSIHFQEGLLNIENHAFYGCENLKEIYLPDSLLSIDENAFQNCSNLKRVSLPDSLREMNLEQIFSSDTTIIYRKSKSPWF